MKRWLLTVSGALLLLWPLVAQNRDFLSGEEIDRVRAAQEPNARLVLYAEFAKDRVDQLSQLLARERAGRSELAHDLLEDYARIIDAIDTVADDALLRRVDVSEGLAAAAGVQTDLLKRLREIEASRPSDVARYEYVLEDAIETTEDSLELSARDLGDRQSDVLAKERRQEVEREAILTPEEAKQRQEQKAKEAKQRKAPTLRRPNDPPPRIP